MVVLNCIILHGIMIIVTYRKTIHFGSYVAINIVYLNSSYVASIGVTYADLTLHSHKCASINVTGFAKRGFVCTIINIYYYY